MEQTTQVSEQQSEQGKITRKKLSKAFWIYQLDCELSSSYERLQSLIFRVSMTPAIREFYADGKKQQKEALKRHLNLFNTEGTIGASIQGVVITMEEEKSNGTAIFDTAITSIKAGLIDPLARIDDSVIWVVLVPSIIPIFVSTVRGGNVIGSIGPLILYTAITLYINWALASRSCTLERNSILNLLKDGKIKQVIYPADVLGVVMMGVLSTDYAKIINPMTFRVTDGVTIVLQDILDRVIEGLLPLATVMAIYFFMTKKGPRYGIIIGTIVLVGSVTSFFGLL